MEKEICKEQLLTLKNRERFTAELVENVDSFSDEQIVLKTGLGGLDIRGKNLKLADFSVEKGTILLEGRIDSVVFVNIREKRSLLKGLFR